jgi:hypothetical protein
MLENLRMDDSIQEDGDILGGFSVLDSNLYDFAVEVAYLDKSEHGAMSFNIHGADKNGNRLRQTLWITNRNGENFYINKNGGKRYLPGFTHANNICLLTVGKDLVDIEPEEKAIKLYDFETRQEIPIKKAVLTDLIGTEITLGMLKVVEDKNVKNADGVYVPSGETREVNEIDKVFRTRDGFTVTEIRAENEEPAFKEKWLAKNVGTVRNKAKGATPGNAPAAAGSNQAAPKPTNSLFA